MSAPKWKVPVKLEGPAALAFRATVSQITEVVLGEVKAGKVSAGSLVMTRAPPEGSLPNFGLNLAGKSLRDPKMAALVPGLLTRALVAPESE